MGSVSAIRTCLRKQLHLQASKVFRLHGCVVSGFFWQWRQPPTSRAWLMFRCSADVGLQPNWRQCKASQSLWSLMLIMRWGLLGNSMWQ